MLANIKPGVVVARPAPVVDKHILLVKLMPVMGLTSKHLRRHNQTTRNQRNIARSARHITRKRSGSISTLSPYGSYTNKEYQMEQWQKLKMYTAWNVIRFIIIGVLVFSYNIEKQSKNKENRAHCCSCYIAAQHPTKYGLDEDRRIDWSYCMPHCVDCTYCNNTFKGMYYITSNF